MSKSLEELNELQQQMIVKLLFWSAFHFICSMGFLLWAYFKWGFK